MFTAINKSQPLPSTSSLSATASPMFMRMENITTGRINGELLTFLISTIAMESRITVPSVAASRSHSESGDGGRGTMPTDIPSFGTMSPESVLSKIKVNSDEAIAEFRSAQFHYNEFSVLLLVALYLMVFITGITGNSLILIWIRKQNSDGSLFNPFLINLCISDHLVLLTCCPLMMYTKITSLWFLGSFSCTFIHYLQGVAVTSNTLSMATISLVRFLLIRYPINQENRSFHRNLRRILLSTIWLISLLTSGPLFFVRSQQTFDVAGQSFTFCLESWSTDLYRKLFSSTMFFTVYVIPSSVLLFCHLKVGYLIRAYEKAVAMTDRLASRKSFNRRGFRVKESDGGVEGNSNGFNHNHQPSPDLTTGQTMRDINLRVNNSYSNQYPDVNPTGQTHVVTYFPFPHQNSYQINPDPNQTRPHVETTVQQPKDQRSQNRQQQQLTESQFQEIREERRSRRLNHKRKQVARLIIWTAYCFVICWLPYNLISLYLDLVTSDMALALLPFTLLLGHFHSAINPFVYWLLNRKGSSKSRSNNPQQVIEMRCEAVRRSMDSLKRKDQENEKIIRKKMQTEEKLQSISFAPMGTSTSMRRHEYF